MHRDMLQFSRHKRINADHRDLHGLFLGYAAGRRIRGSGNAVQIRNNSHYRNRLEVGMLIGLRPVKDSWANGETWERYGRVSLFLLHPKKGAFILSFV